MNSSSISYLPPYGSVLTEHSSFSLQDATWSYLKNPYAIRIDGCILPDGTQNCSVACSSVDDIFAKAATFQNCLAYPLISQSLADTNATAGSVPAVSQYGIRPGDSNGSRAIISAVTTCLRGWASITYGNDTQKFERGCSPFLNLSAYLNSFPIPSNSTNLTNIYRSPTAECLISEVCTQVDLFASPSADVAGIGMYISYVIHMALLLLYWLVIEYFRFWHPIIFRNRRNHEKGGKELLSSRQREIFIESALDFHKAQCYFMGTITIAALVVSNTDGLRAITSLDFDANKTLLNMLSTAGSLPIMLILVKLRLMGHRSIYVFVLSTLVLGLALATSFSTWRFVDVKGENLATESTTRICGCSSINPTRLCLGGFGNFEASWTPFKASIFSSTVWLIVLVDVLRQVEHTKRCFSKLNRLLAGQKVQNRRVDRTRIIWIRLSFGILELCFNIGTIYLIQSYIQFLYINKSSSSTQWTFGQLTAILIWVPPVVQYIYLQFHGPEGDRWHLPDTLEISRKDQTKNKEEDFPAETERRGRESPHGINLDLLNVPNRPNNSRRSS